MIYHYFDAQTFEDARKRRRRERIKRVVVGILGVSIGFAIMLMAAMR